MPKIPLTFSRPLFLAALTLAMGNLPAAGPSPTPYKFNAMNRHEAFLKIAKAGNVDVVFFGDSITDYWRNTGKAEWARYVAPLKAANFGIAGDGTRGVLWRIQNGELEGIHPKLVVLLIGTNNLGEKPEKIAEVIKQIIAEIQSRSPGTRILLMGIFPRDSAKYWGREKIKKGNEILATYAAPDDPKRVIFMDIGDKFLNEDLSIKQDLMPGTLHLGPKGFEVWAESVLETVKQQLK